MSEEMTHIKLNLKNYMPNALLWWRAFNITNYISPTTYS